MHLDDAAGLAAGQLLFDGGRGDAQAVDGKQDIAGGQTGQLRRLLIVDRRQLEFIALIDGFDAQ